MADAVVFATKGNLINIRKTLSLAKLGFELIDRKRNVLIREMMTHIEDADRLRQSIDVTYKKAYRALQRANVTLGVCTNIANSMPVENGLRFSSHSVMGVDIPRLILDSTVDKTVPYSFSSTNSQLDVAYMCFGKVKELTVKLAEIENSVFRLASEIKKTQKRANALKNMIIPRLESQAKMISDSLEEKEREEFSRLRVIKKMTQKNKS